jgi:cytochrome c556
MTEKRMIQEMMAMLEKMEKMAKDEKPSSTLWSTDVAIYKALKEMERR